MRAEERERQNEQENEMDKAVKKTAHGKYEQNSKS